MRKPITTSMAVIDGAKLSKARVDAGFSMEDIASFLGCNKSSVSRWEQGLLNPTPERIQKLEMLLRCEGLTVIEAKLNWTKVRQIRRFCAEGKKSRREIGKMYGVSAEVVLWIEQGKTWKEEGAGK